MSYTKTLYYAHDPMCSWCWAFRPTLTKVLASLPSDIKVKYLVGGLAPDSDIPMNQETQDMIKHHWQLISQRIPGTSFNFDFWACNTPKRSTYSACRAVLAAKMQNTAKEDAMIFAIQQAYYLQAQNPSEESVLIACADTISLNIEQFRQDISSPQIQGQLLEHIKQVADLGITGFPALVLVDHHQAKQIVIDYNNDKSILSQIV